MNTWNDIYDYSDKIFRQVLEQIEEEKPVNEFSSPEILNGRLQEQLQYDSFSAYRKLKKHRRRHTVRWYGVAAGIMLFLGLTWGWLGQGPDSEDLLTETICPGNKKAVLALADGSVWYVGDTVMTITTARENICIDSNGLFFRTSKEVVQCDDDTYHFLTVPRGGEFTMTLSDGSRVWLNAESELRFPLQFASGRRKVFLTGEAYFEVEKDTEHPFIVEVNGSEIEVLGTGFNVRSYRNEGRVVTTLAEGNVCFRSADSRILLEPGEQSILNEDGVLWKQKVDIYPYIAWKDGRFVFRKQRLEDIMTTVGRWYNVEVRFKDEESKNITFSGGTMRYEGFEVFVKMIEAIGSVKCNIEGTTVCVAKNK